MLTPERMKTIMPAILANSGGIPVELHSHCTTGLAPVCYAEAVQLGCHVLHTAIPPARQRLVIAVAGGGCQECGEPRFSRRGRFG